MRYSSILLISFLFALVTAIAAAPVYANLFFCYYICANDFALFSPADGTALHVLSRRSDKKVSDIKSLSSSLTANPDHVTDFNTAVHNYNHFKQLATTAATTVAEFKADADGTTDEKKKKKFNQKKVEAQRKLNGHVDDANAARTKAKNLSAYALYESD